MRKVVLGLVVGTFIGLTLFGGLATTSVAEHACDPYPIGRCGNFQRETVKFCYYVVGGRMVEAADPNVVSMGPNVPGLVSLEGKANGMVYVRKAPYQAIVDDPYEAPLPIGSVYQESNAIPGLQTAKFRCGDFIWYAECEPMQWMHFNYSVYEPDRILY